MHTHFDFLYLLLSLSRLCWTENIHINRQTGWYSFTFLLRFNRPLLARVSASSIAKYIKRKARDLSYHLSLSLCPSVCLSLSPSGQIALSCWLYLREALLSFSLLQPFTNSHKHTILPDRLGKMCAGNLPESCGINQWDRERERDKKRERD